MRHVAYGDERGTPGSVVTFFDMPGVAPGRPGSGMVHRLLLRVADEEHVLLKVCFPLAVRAPTATYEMQFGYAERPTHFSTAADAAKY